MYKFILLAVLTFANASFAGEMLYKDAGFSIDALDSAIPAQGLQPVQMFLPAVNGFSANINVQVQPYAESIEAYQKLSEDQFMVLGLTKISSAIEDNAFIVEYTGELNEMNLHFYAKAVKKGGFVYLATATDLVSEWPKKSAQLKQVVHSLKLQ